LGTDTTRNIASLLFSGTASKFPDIRFIFSHGGGTAPYLMNRFVTVMQRPEIAARLPNGLKYEVQKFYYDTAMFYNPDSWPTLKKVVPISHIVYGTDYPFVTPETVAKGLDECGFSPSERRAIDRDNAAGLFPRLKKA
jgi:predicted TIM-barrel fold metal-dependent hydrolase